jgi:DNA-binding NarL/FixJ family response regulator
VDFLAAPEVRPWVETARSTARNVASLSGLTRREREVAALVALGLTNKQIASRLSVAEKTVEMHVSNGLGKLGFTTRVQLASWAISQRLADPRAAQG